jgi:hypothetical protein
MNEILMRLVAESLAFLELTDDELIDPDIAVKQLESITDSLQKLSKAERETFLRFVDDVMAPEARSAHNEDAAELYGRMREDLGLQA